MKDVFWVGSSLDDHKKFPEEVQKKIGYILQRVQEGLISKIPKGKIEKLKSIRRRSNVYEIKSDYSTDTYRAIYLGNLGNRIYVLHCFQKKSKVGRKTPPGEIEKIRVRLDWVIDHQENRHK